MIAAAGDPEFASRAADARELARAALAAEGEVVLERDRASARAEAGAGAPFAAAPTELVGRIAQVAEAVLEHVTFGRNQRALDAGEPFVEQVAAYAVGVGRLEAGRDLQNLCLHLVRAHLQLRHRDRARELALRCFATSPDLQADERLHPPGVHEVVASIRAELEGGAGGVLAIQAGGTDQAGCAIRANGRVVGRSPWARVALPVGTYGVQIECTDGMPGRVFRVDVQSGEPTRVTVPARFAETIATGDGLALVYAGQADLASWLPSDVATLGRLLEVDHVLVAVVDSHGVAVRAFEVTDDAVARLTGSAPVPEPVDDRTSREAIESVRAGHIESAETLATPSIVLPVPAENDLGVTVLGGSFVTVGVVGLAVGWYFWSELDARGQDLNRATTPDHLTHAQIAFDDARLPVLVAGTAGATLATLGLPFLLPREPDMPWWSWLVGGAGLAIAGTGIAFMAIDSSCWGDVATAPCVRRTPNAVLGTLILEHAAPFIAVPITYAFRLVVGPTASRDVAVAITPYEGGGAIRLGGTW